MSEWNQRVFLARTPAFAEFHTDLTYDDIVPWTGRVPACYSSHPTRRPAVAPAYRCRGCFAAWACKNSGNTTFSGREVFRRLMGKPLADTVVETRYDTLEIGGGKEP